MTIADKTLVAARPATPAGDPTPRRFTRREYCDMAATGMFEGQRVELIDGEILRMSPQSSPHAAAIALLHEWLTLALAGRFTIRGQMPLVVAERSEPEPDLAVIPGAAKDQRDHPRTALLVIEVSSTTLDYDRRKAGLYASAGVSEYWIINLSARQIEVYRQPRPDAAAEFGHRYAAMQTYDVQQQIQPASLPLSPTPVTDLLPAS